MNHMGTRRQFARHLLAVGLAIPTRARAWAFSDDIDERVKKLVMKALGLEESVYGVDKCLVKDLGADSVDFVEIIMEVEKEFDLDVPDEDAEKLDTPRKLADYIRKKMGKQ